MNERDWLRYKSSQLEMALIVRRAQVTARWVIAMSNAVITKARQGHILFLPREKK